MLLTKRSVAQQFRTNRRQECGGMSGESRVVIGFDKVELARSFDHEVRGPDTLERLDQWFSVQARLHDFVTSTATAHLGVQARIGKLASPTGCS
jgi:hypothetical protein